MITKAELEKALYRLLVDSVCILPENTMQALLRARDREVQLLPMLHMESTIKNITLSKERMIPICGDTGYPVFYVRTGPNPPIEGGLPALERTLISVVAKATDDAWIRPSMVDPFTQDNPGTNTGPNMPHCEYRFEPALDYLEIASAPKGGGTEIFGPNFRVLIHADGVKGLKKFVMESVFQACQSGAACPPNIVGVGVGGTADLCMKLAKEAAVLRPIGDRHPEPRIAALEEELLEAINELGLGPLGTGGKTTALDVHIEYAPAHLAGFPVGVCVQCPAARLATLCIHADGSTQRLEWPNWFARREVLYR